MFQSSTPPASWMNANSFCSFPPLWASWLSCKAAMTSVQNATSGLSRLWMNTKWNNKIMNKANWSLFWSERAPEAFSFTPAIRLVKISSEVNRVKNAVKKYRYNLLLLCTFFFCTWRTSISFFLLVLLLFILIFFYKVLISTWIFNVNLSWSMPIWI